MTELLVFRTGPKDGRMGHRELLPATSLRLEQADGNVQNTWCATILLKHLNILMPSHA